MDVVDIQQDQFFDIFGNKPSIDSNAIEPPKFGSEEANRDILGSTTETTTLASSTTETTTIAATKSDDSEADLFQNKPGRKPKYDFSDLSGYYQDRVTKGLFVPIDEEDNEGKKTSFIPKTPEEFDEVIKLQIDYKLEQEKKKLEQDFYETKSPAWKAVMKFSEMVDDPAEILPFIQGVKTIQSVSNLDENDLDSAEKIVRVRMEQRGDPANLIESQIEALKQTDKLISTAKQLKPIIVQEEQQQLSQKVQAEKQREAEYNQMINEISQSAIKAIETPIFGKNKLKVEEKGAIYDLIGAPSEKTGGFLIYNAIDDLFDKRDFETLRQVALLLTKKESFYNYLGATVADRTAAALEKKLRVSTENNSSSANDDFEEKVSFPRNKLSQKPKFGRE